MRKFIAIALLTISAQSIAYGWRLTSCVQANVYNQIVWVATFVNDLGYKSQQFYPVNQYPYCPQYL